MKYSIFLLALSLASNAFAYDEERARNNLGHDFATCAAFYFLAAKGAERLKSDASGKSMQAGELAAKFSDSVTSPKVTSARINMALNDMMGEMDNDYSNFSVLMNKYLDSCKSILNQPDQRAKYWLDKED